MSLDQPDYKSIRDANPTAILTDKLVLSDQLVRIEDRLASIDGMLVPIGSVLEEILNVLTQLAQHEITKP